MKTHTYDVGVNWTGNDGEGTKTYRSYRRDHTIIGGTKLAIPGSSDPAFRGDPTRYSPEELLVGSLSACHMLWYLHLCAVNGIVVIDYRDAATGTMEETPDGSGAFTRVVLEPSVTIAAGCDVAKAGALHEEAHRLCYIANSVKFAVTIEGTVVAGPE
jgi:organic hydroperoxide reductase OsmC/OhrA